MDALRRRPLAALFGFALLAVLILTACAAAPPATHSPAAMTAAAPGEAEPMLMPTASPAFAASQPIGTPGAPIPLNNSGAMIIKNAEMDLLVEDTDIALDRVMQIAADNGGYVLSTQTWQAGEGKSADVTIAVRVENFETALRRLRDIALEVQRESASGEDVSAEFVDLGSRVRNLEATRDRLRTFLDQAKTVDEALAVNRELSDIEAQIEEVQGRMNYLSGRAAYSLIKLSLTMPGEATPTPTPTPIPGPWSLSPTVSAAADAQVKLLRGILEVATWVVIVLGPYAALGVVLLLMWRALRALLKRSKPPANPDNQP